MSRGGFTHEPAAGGSPEWYTPPHIFSALRLGFDLDPCAPPLPACPWIPAARRISLPEDGLAADWHGTVWLNPPYGLETPRWVGKLMEHGEGIALTFVRSDTSWWREAARLAGAICFISGRLNFVPSLEHLAANGTASSAGAPSCLIAFGWASTHAVLRSGLGPCLQRHPDELRAQLQLAT